MGCGSSSAQGTTTRRSTSSKSLRRRRSSTRKQSIRQQKALETSARKPSFVPGQRRSDTWKQHPSAVDTSDTEAEPAPKDTVESQHSAVNIFGQKPHHSKASLLSSAIETGAENQESWFPVVLSGESAGNSRHRRESSGGEHKKRRVSSAELDSSTGSAKKTKRVSSAASSKKSSISHHSLTIVDDPLHWSVSEEVTPRGDSRRSSGQSETEISPSVRNVLRSPTSPADGELPCQRYDIPSIASLQQLDRENESKRRVTPLTRSVRSADSLRRPRTTTNSNRTSVADSESDHDPTDETTTSTSNKTPHSQ